MGSARLNRAVEGKFAVWRISTAGTLPTGSVPQTLCLPAQYRRYSAYRLTTTGTSPIGSVPQALRLSAQLPDERRPIRVLTLQLLRIGSFIIQVVVSGGHGGPHEGKLATF